MDVMRRALIMAMTLGGGAPGVVVQNCSVRSGPRAFKAHRYDAGDCRSRGPESRGGLTDDLLEAAAERREAREPHVGADLGDRAVRSSQQAHRPFDPAPLEVAAGRLSERLP